MHRENWVIFFVAVLFLVGACSFSSQAIQSVPQPTNPPGQPTIATQLPLSGENGLVSSPTATQPPLSGNTGTGGAKPDIQGSFPLPPDSRITSPDSSDPGDPGGSFTIQTQSAPETVVKFYADTLPKQGWILRYTDANFSGGAIQYWKKRGNQDLVESFYYLAKYGWAYYRNSQW